MTPDIEIVVMNHLMKLPTVGELKAKRIVKEFGAANVAEILDKAPDRILDVPGIRREAAERIIAAWRTTRQEFDRAMRVYKGELCESQN